MKNQLDLKDPTLLLIPHPSFKCCETLATSNDFQEENEEDSDDDDDEIGRIKFSCTVPFITTPTTHCSSDSSDNNEEDNIAKEIQYDTTTLHFRCRDKSVGFLNSNEKSTISTEDEDDGVADPNFFDTGYTLAGKTGFQIWAGSRVMMEGLLPWGKNDNVDETISTHTTCSKLVQNEIAWNKLIYYQDLISNGAKVLEFGSGVGVVGASLASIGGEVLLTDLPSLVDNSLWPNLIANKNSKSIQGQNDDDDLKEYKTPSWLGKDVVQINKGWASTTAMDWSKPLTSQLSNDQINGIEIIISCDCVWLVSMLDGLLDSVSSVFENSTEDVSFLMSFQRRDTIEGNASSTFTTVDRVLSSVEDRGWKLQCLAWRPVIVIGDDDFKEEKDVFVFEIKP